MIFRFVLKDILFKARFLPQDNYNVFHALLDLSVHDLRAPDLVSNARKVSGKVLPFCPHIIFLDTLMIMYPLHMLKAG